jgi:hypothetical protein
LAEVWQALGYARDGFNGVVPFEWGEVESFTRLTATDLAPCEAFCLVEMSRAYCIEISNRSPLRKPPMERAE